MASQWTLVVEGLGKIQRAEVDMSPLTLFVGENNTGKSYLATVLWGLRRLPPWAYAESKSLESYSLCTKWVTRNYPNKTKISHADAMLFVTWMNDSMKKFGSTMITMLFNDDEFSLNNIEIKYPSTMPPLTIEWTDRTAQNKEFISELRKGTTDEEELIFIASSQDIQSKPDSLFNYIFLIASTLLFRDLHGLSSRETYFLPASRTGFMLLYRPLTNYSVERAFGNSDSANERNPSRLSKSAVDFLKLIGSGLTDKPGPFAAEADDLEKVLRGSLELRRGVGMNQYYYHSEDGHEIAMPLVSSMVTELAPIILVLRHAPSISMLVLEEPEVHLHPAVQRKLAVVIARLIRKGVKVVITTHGDLFCHQLNNLIKLGAHPRRAEMQAQLGYTDMDYLLPDEVSGYDFHHVGTQTEVSRLKMTEFGLVMPTFNDELRNLVAESRALEATPEESP